MLPEEEIRTSTITMESEYWIVIALCATVLFAVLGTLLYYKCCWTKIARMNNGANVAQAYAVNTVGVGNNPNQNNNNNNNNNRNHNEDVSSDTEFLNIKMDEDADRDRDRSNDNHNHLKSSGGSAGSSSSEQEDSDILISDEDNCISIQDAKNAIYKPVRLANVRYVSMAMVVESFEIRQSLLPHKYRCGDIITFKEIVLGYYEGIKDTRQRKQLMREYFSKHSKIDNISTKKQIFEFVDFLTRVVIRTRFNINERKYVCIRDESNILLDEQQNEAAHNNNSLPGIDENGDKNNKKAAPEQDICKLRKEIETERKPITDWIWANKMNKHEMNIELFVQNLDTWFKEI